MTERSDYEDSGIDDDVARLHRAEHWLSIRRPERALEELAGLGGAFATSPHAYFVRARAELLLGRTARAAATLRSSIEQHGPRPHELYVLAEVLHQRDDEVGAEAAILQALAFDPDNADYLTTYAAICLASGDPEKATRLVDRAAQSEPGSADVLGMRAMLAYARGDNRTAARLERELLAADPEGAAANALSTFLSANRGDVSQAYTSARRVVADNPDNRDAIEAARELKVASHWALWPLRPTMRFGPIPVYVAAMCVLLLTRVAVPPLFVPLALLWFAYAVYSWTAPSLVRWLVRRR